jgi:uncharacterized SAM-binding protein YcdF (DUF218 family)
MEENFADLTVNLTFCPPCSSISSMLHIFNKQKEITLTTTHDNRINELAKLIWDYHLLHHSPEKADCIFALGCHDAGVAVHAARLFLEGWADTLVISGGVLFDKEVSDLTEAEYFRGIAIELGVPASRIITENRATNTGENFQFTETLLRELKLDFNKFIIVQKPYMERRTFATGMMQWKGKQLILASERISFNEYLAKGISRDRILNTMAGDLQRIKLYPAKGFQVYQEIPANVWQAFEELVSYGYDKRLVKDVGR